MTESLTARLQKRLASQSAEIEAMTSTELRRLATSLQHECSAALNSTRADIQDTTETLDASLMRLRRFGRWWWVALIVTWLVLGGLSVWHLIRPASLPVQTITSNGRTYLIPPAGAEATMCERGEQRFLCVRLPEGN